jgi:MoxR-like ATPase
MLYVHRGQASWRSPPQLPAVRGRNYAIPDDVKDIIYVVLAHRLVLSEEAEKEGVTTAAIIDGVLANAK